jgi:hypothetical protein
MGDHGALLDSDTATSSADTGCECRPNIPLEIAGSALIWGVPAYWGYRGIFDDTTKYFPAGPAIIAISLFLPLVSLAPIAKWTSGCDANWIHALVVGFGSNLLCTLAYGIAYGNHHPLNYHRINWPEYLALGLIPTVIATYVYNLFLRPKSPFAAEPTEPDQGTYFLPSVLPNKTFGFNFGIHF